MDRFIHGCSSQNPRSADLMDLGARCQAPRHGIANAAAERVHQVFFRMAIGREVDPLAAPALAAIVSERVLQPHAPRVDHQVAGFQKVLEDVEPVQDQVLRPPGDDARAEHPLVLGVGRRAERRSSRRGRVERTWSMRP